MQDADVVGADFLGQAVIPVSDIIGGQLFDGWLDLTDSSGNQLYGVEFIEGDKRPSRVHITMQFKPVDAEVRKQLVATCSSSSSSRAVG